MTFVMEKSEPKMKFPPQPVPSLHVALSVAVISRFVSVDVQECTCT